MLARLLSALPSGFSRVWGGPLLMGGLVAGLAACSDGPVDGPFGGSDLGTAEEGIVNGSVDTTHQAVVAWIKGGKCTATIVDVVGNDGYALTAAHCVGSNLGVLRQGDNHANGQYDVEYTVAEAVVHPLYADLDNGSFNDKKSAAWDFAMLRFTGATGSTPVISPIAKVQDNIGNGSQLDIVGYGQTENGGTTIRRHVVKPVVGNSEIMLNYDQSSSGMCFGDSGGPNLYTVGATEYVAGVNSAVQNNDCSGISRAGRVSAITSTFVAPFIAGQPFGEQTCDECTAGHTQAGNGDCIPELSTCFNDAACESWIDCRNTCSDLACVVQCDQMYPGGKALYDDVVSCLCTACDSECATDGLCQPPAVCYLDSVNDDCQACYEGACCAEATACASDSECISCATSPFPPGHCPDVQTWTDFVGCTQTNCDGICFFSTGGGEGGSGAAGVGGAGGGAVGVGGQMVGVGGDPVGAGGAGGEPVSGDEQVIEGEGCGCALPGRSEDGPTNRALMLIGLGIWVARRRRPDRGRRAA